jgi:hypothetical protein
MILGDVLSIRELPVRLLPDGGGACLPFSSRVIWRLPSVPVSFAARVYNQLGLDI